LYEDTYFSPTGEKGGDVEVIDVVSSRFIPADRDAELDDLKIVKVFKYQKIEQKRKGF